MLFFSKRTMIEMMYDLFPKLSNRDRKELATSLDSLDDVQALQATWELAVLATLCKQLNAVPQVKIPESNKKPDCEIDIGLGKKIIIDVKSPTGDSLAFREFLLRVTSRIRNVAENIRGGSRNLLHIRYHEWKKRTENYSLRVPSVREDVEHYTEFLRKLEAFLLNDEKLKERIIVDGVISADFTKSYAGGQYDHYSCQIPSSPQNVIDSMTSSLIDRATSQFEAFRGQNILGLIVCDGGNAAISDPYARHGWGTVTGADMMHYVIAKAGIDFIVSIGRKDYPNGFISGVNDKKTLSINFFFEASFDHVEANQIRAQIGSALELIPVPIIHPYQSKSMRRRVIATGRANPYYNVSSMHMSRDDRGEMKTSHKISSRALASLLSGVMTWEQFQSDHLDEWPPEYIPPKGKIGEIYLERKGGVDDDVIVFSFEKDLTGLSFSEINKHISTKS